MTMYFLLNVPSEQLVGDWTSLLPAFVAILLALLLKEVLISLAIGIFTGLSLIGMRSGKSLLQAFVDIPMYIREALYDKDHLSVILFTLLIGAMVGVISKNGGMMALVKRIAIRANTPRSVQMASWVLGIAIFFDDYANTLVVGKTMRPLSDRFKISREKLAYIVDSTAAPIAAIAFITTWIGAELGYITDGIAQIPQGPEIIGSAYGVFFNSLKFMFYPILTLFFVWLIIRSGKDFGPMLQAERKARQHGVQEGGEVYDMDKIPENKEFISNAIVPIVMMLLVSIIGLFHTGSANYVWDGGLNFFTNVANIIGKADSYNALIWGSFAGLSTAIFLTIVRRVLGLKSTMGHAESGIKNMIPAIMILALAWTLGAVTEALGTAGYLTALLDKHVAPQLLPTIVFVIASLIAFSTGTSWGTMTILYPIVLSTSWMLSIDNGLSVDVAFDIFGNVAAAVLAGAVLGDHCSPISDTTILSSLSTDCDHVAHVKTQMPYALTVGGVSILLGILPASYGIPFYITFPVCILALFGIVSYFGKMVENEPLSAQ